MARITTTNYAGSPTTSFAWATAGTDKFSRTQDLYYLAQAVENHDHTSGKGLAAGRVANGSIGTVHLAAGAVDASKLATDAVTAIAVALDAIGALELADNAVDTAAIQAGAVTLAKLAADSVDSSKIVNGSIVNGDLAAGVAVANIGYTPANKAGESFTGAVNVAGSITATGGTSDVVSPRDVTAARDVSAVNQLKSTVAIGTAPLSVVSTTEVANLNASRVAGKIPTATPAAGALPLADGSGKLDSWVSVASNGRVIGELMNWSGATEPAGWKLMNGQTISRTTYATLWALWGNPNTGDGSTTFTLMDTRGRFMYHRDNALPIFSTGGSHTYNMNHSHPGGGQTGSESADNGLGNNGGVNTPAVGHTHADPTTGASTTLGSVTVTNPYFACNQLVYVGP